MQHRTQNGLHVEYFVLLRHQYQRGEVNIMLSPEQRRKLVIDKKIADCKDCGEMLDVSEFYLYSNGMPNRRCKSCFNKVTSERLKTEKGKQWKKKSHTKESKVAKNAWGITNRAIQNGTLIVPSECPKCGSTKRIQAHHEDYSKPYDVIWLCEVCHKQLHLTNKTSAKCNC